MALHTLAQRLPVHGFGHVDINVAATLVAQQIERILRENTAIPQRSLVGCVTTALLGNFCRSPIGVISNRLHRLIGELNRLVRSVGNAQRVQTILKAHYAHSHRAVAQIGVARLFDCVVVDVNYIVEHAHSR